MLLSILLSFSSTQRLIAHKYLIHGTELEIVWTILPAVVLMAIALPSFQLLYLMDEVVESGVTIKAIGSQ
jgi:cytochrome c oxidase subunit 2